MLLYLVLAAVPVVQAGWVVLVWVAKPGLVPVALKRDQPPLLLLEQPGAEPVRLQRLVRLLLRQGGHLQCHYHEVCLS